MLFDFVSSSTHKTHKLDSFCGDLLSLWTFVSNSSKIIDGTTLTLQEHIRMGFSLEL